MGFFRVIRNAPIVSIFIVLMLIFCAWFFLYDDSSPKAVKKYVKGKFPISDYLYKKADEKKILPQNNVVKQETKEERIKKSCKGQITDNKGNLIDDDCNIIA
ncbi:DNA transformation compentancy, partial [Helicobacter pylori]